jgi:hypothetical protein
MHSTAALRWHLPPLPHPLLAGLQSTTLASRCGAGLLVHTCGMRDVHVADCPLATRREVGRLDTDVLLAAGIGSNNWNRKQRPEVRQQMCVSAVTLYVYGLRANAACVAQATNGTFGCRNAEALGNALLVCMIFPWFLCFVFYTGALG